MNQARKHDIQRYILSEIENELHYFLRDVELRIDEVIKEVYNEIDDSRRNYQTISLKISRSNPNKRFALTLLEKICDHRIEKLNELEELFSDEHIEELVVEKDLYEVYELFRGGDSPDVVKDYNAHEELRDKMREEKVDEESYEIVSELFDKLNKIVAA